MASLTLTFDVAVDPNLDVDGDVNLDSTVDVAP
jgi:hypothetical protein